MRVALLAFVPSLLAAAAPVQQPFAAVLAAADARHASRAQGAVGDTALPGPADEAIAGYRRALQIDPGSNEARWKLVRALFFRWSFCGTTAADNRALVEEARSVANAGLERIERQIAGTRAGSRMEALRAIPHAAALHFWAAVAWGEWALVRGKLAAARRGAASRIRDLARTVIDLDPQLEEGGGYRVLGRLHDQSPRIPFLTGWVSRGAAVSNLRRALAIAPGNSVNQVFLAEALMRDPKRVDEVRALLQRCAASAPREEYLVEDRHYAAVARRDLSRLAR